MKMKIDRIRVAGLTTAILAVLIFWTLTVEYTFPLFKYAEPSARLVEDETSIIGPEVSRFLWDYRVIDLIAQAFVLFAAAVCCMALLRPEKRKR
jgi:multisubunit Na+/H+ antiporter MnhB subunit